jgi:hypothetical protein
VDEAAYWPSLEYRVCREFAGMSDPQLRSLWCDGFIPGQYLVSETPPRIEGWAWICDGRSQHEWGFTLLLAHRVETRDEIPWASLLPAEDMTRWLALDARGQRIHIEPMAAVRDSANMAMQRTRLRRAADLWR